MASEEVDVEPSDASGWDRGPAASSLPPSQRVTPLPPLSAEMSGNSEALLEEISARCRRLLADLDCIAGGCVLCRCSDFLKVCIQAFSPLSLIESGTLRSLPT